MDRRPGGWHNGAMFILPISHKPDWRRPPWATMALILINCIVFFAFQTGDQKVWREAMEFHRSSELGKLEFPRYISWLKTHERGGDAYEFERGLTAYGNAAALRSMQSDEAFMAKLRANEVITANEPDYAPWRQKRDQLDGILKRLVTERYALVPARHDPIGYFTCMFLHGGADHLFGNMVVLAIVGFMVERLLGGGKFLLFYLISGLGSSLLSGLVHAGSTVPEVGASGAISGAMAMYTVLYGLQRIRFFYLVVFYFDTMEAPAIALLPLFIANEAYQLLADAHGHVNYLAHLGGLISGALITWGYEQWRKPKVLPRKADDDAGMEAEPEEAPLSEAEQFEQDRAKARRMVGRLDFEAARRAYDGLVQRRPDDWELVEQCYHVARLTPESAEYHVAACRILDGKNPAPDFPALMARVLKDYLKVAKEQADLPPRRLATLAVRLSRQGFDEEGRHLSGMLSRQHPTHPYLPAVLLEVGKCLARKGAQKEAQGYLHSIVNRFPDSKEAKVAMSLLV